ncbi:MAG: hypothetical protein IJC62_01245 [Clostridia bacterium]|nr:hypothetical protein [Clostridia bacterium]
MKRIIYSGFLKFVAVLLFIASIVAGTLSVTRGIMEFHDEEIQLYSFEPSFEQSSIMTSMLMFPEDVVMEVYDSLFFEHDQYGRWSGPVDPDSVDRDLIKQKLEEWLPGSYYSDLIKYYVRWDDIVLTNCGAKSPEELMNGDFYSYVKREGLGDIEREESSYTYRHYKYSIDYMTGERTIVISTSIREEVVNEYRTLWEKQENIVIDAIIETLVCIGIALLMLVYLICVCGKSHDGEFRTTWVDNIWAEVHLAAMAIFGVYGVVLCVLIIDEYIWDSSIPLNLILVAVGAIAGLASAVVLTSLLSIIRNIKCRRLIDTSLVLRVIRWIFRGFAAFWRIIWRALSRKTGFILIAMLLVYTAIIGLFGVFLPHSPVWLVLGILVFLFACFIIGYRVRDIEEIKRGVRAIRCGDVSYKIPEPKCEDMKMMVGNINDIARGLDESVAAKVRAERMKTELITNVSHDLKTPLTSIISYTELLSNMDDLPEEARDYVAVIAKKGDRLKKLTQDLFDISKVQSGNESAALEKLDVSLLINQSLAEHDGEIADSGLTFCVDAPKELYVLADGRKMSRVLGNLIGNALKYSMRGTRVIITAAERGGEVVMEIKNISSYPMNFSSDEIVGRFVRGDESRTEEGNGLGLAIAKSYTEICGGRFEIVIDGDLFKAVLTLRKYD